MRSRYRPKRSRKRGGGVHGAVVAGKGYPAQAGELPQAHLVEDLPGLLFAEGIPHRALPAGQVAEDAPRHLLPPGKEHEGGEEAVPPEGGHEPGDARGGHGAFGGGEEEGPQVQEGLGKRLPKAAFPFREGGEEGLVAGQGPLRLEGAYKDHLPP